MDVGFFADKLIGIAIGLWAIFQGTRIKKREPDKTIKIIRPVKLGRFFTGCGVIILLGHLTLFLAALAKK